MQTQLTVWKYSSLFVPAVLMVALFGYGLHQGFTKGYRHEITRKGNPWAFWGTTFVAVVGLATGLIVLSILVAAIIQKGP